MKINDSLINRFNEFNSWALKAKNIYGEYRTREERYEWIRSDVITILRKIGLVAL